MDTRKSDNEESASSRIAKQSTVASSRRTFLKGTGALAATVTLGSQAATAHGTGSHGDCPLWTCRIRNIIRQRFNGNRVVGYYPAWAGDYTPADIPFDKITHLNYAFLNPQSDGTVVVGSDSRKELLSELSAYDDTNTVFVLSISGGWYPQEYSDAAATAESRKRFAKTAVDIMEKYNFDGLDLDWEYPDGTTRPEDPHNFTLLLEACRDELNSRFGPWPHLTIAASPNPNIVDDAYEVESIKHYLDHINVMTYDYHGSWSNDTNFNAPFDSPSGDPDGQQTWNTSNHMEQWAKKPIPNDKLLMGMPFYGRAFSGVASENNGLFNPFDSSDSETYYNIRENIKTQPDYEYHWHQDAKVPWVYSAEEKRFIGYDNVDSVSNKIDFVNDKGFGGAMCWELSHDPSNTLVDVMHTQLQE